MPGRRGARVEDAERWVFNRLADAYRSRPGYPEALVDRLVELALPGGRVVDLGAGTGDLAIPLASRGLQVAAVEPARRMLDELERRAAARRIPIHAACAVTEAANASDRREAPVHERALRTMTADARAQETKAPPRAAHVAAETGSEPNRREAPIDENGLRADDRALFTVHAASESTGLPAATFDLAVVADALHWLDPELAGAEIGRLLAPGGALAIVEVELLPSPFLDALWPRLQASNPKARPRALDLSGPRTQLFSLAAPFAEPLSTTLDCEHTLSAEAAASVVTSLSFAGPALAPAALESLTTWAAEQARSSRGQAAWRRRLHLHWVRRAGP